MQRRIYFLIRTEVLTTCFFGGEMTLFHCTSNNSKDIGYTLTIQYTVCTVWYTTVLFLPACGSIFTTGTYGTGSSISGVLHLLNKYLEFSLLFACFKFLKRYCSSQKKCLKNVIINWPFVFIKKGKFEWLYIKVDFYQLCLNKKSSYSNNIDPSELHIIICFYHILSIVDPFLFFCLGSVQCPS
jgi:hypothetical protein